MDGSTADVELLRPSAWLTDQQAEVGGTIEVSVPECGIEGQANVQAGDLKVGEHLLGDTGRVEITAISPRGPPEPVYNLEILGDHNYKVSSAALLVHDNCPKPNKSQRTYVTYTADDLNFPGRKYVGRSSGVDMTPEQILNRRKSGHHRNLGPLQLDQTTTSYSAIRGREQLVRDHLVNSGFGTDQINPIGPRNKNIDTYLQDVIDEFGGF